jgi:hypothetical protein
MTKIHEINPLDFGRVIDSMEGPQLSAECYNFALDQLLDAMAQSGEAWHLTLLRASIVGLWHQHPRGKVLVGYVIADKILVLAYITKRGQMPSNFYSAVRTVPGYFETGTSFVPHRALRPLACWEWPCTCTSLWPVGDRFDPTEPRAVDTGNLMGYFSFPVKKGISPATAGPEFVQVPMEEFSDFTFKDLSYWHFNRWAVMHSSNSG